MVEEKQKMELVAYSTDASMIKGQATSVLFPKSAEEISQIVKNSSGVVPRGAGTGLAGGAVPQNCAVVDLSKMNQILEFNREKKAIEVEAGIVLDELNDYLSIYSLEFPVKPSSHSVCTIGGMIATNAVGSRAIKYGRTSEWVESIEVVDGKGETLKIGKTDLSDFAGMEGITGIITRAKLKLVSLKKRTASILEFGSLEEVQNHVIKLKSRNDISAIEFMDKFTSSVLGLSDKYHIIVEYESEEGKLKDREYSKIMELRDRIYPALASLGYTRIEDPKIMIGKFSEFADFLEENKIPFFGHLGVGIVHPVFRAGEEKRISEAIKLAKKLHGQVSGEHGIGLAKKKFLDENDNKLIARIKSRHDPANKLNCGKVIG